MSAARHSPWYARWFLVEAQPPYASLGIDGDEWVECYTITGWGARRLLRRWGNRNMRVVRRKNWWATR